jgi:CubicO group peptidase (beta-lactamase class C family)
MASEPIARSKSFAVFVPEFERLIAEMVEEWKVPGLAVAVVQNGEVAFASPYGLRDVEAGLKVTTDTQFQLMSVAKSFTATGLALLVDERRMDWKKPVREYIPEFRMHDAVASDRVTVRDLLCHHSGLPSHNWIWLPGDMSPTQMLAAMRHLELSDDIRSTFQYSNLGYLVASMVAERVSGRTWADFTRVRLTDKLRMDVTFKMEELAAAANGAVPYAMTGDTCLRSKLWPISVTAAAGMSMSIAGFANWLRFHLGKGEFEGQRLLSPSLIQELQKPRVHVGAPAFSEYSDVHYGLGFRSHRYRGERVVWHGGGFTGTNTLMMMLPDRSVGVAVLANIGMVPPFAPHILANYVFDRVCQKELAPWLDRFRDQRHKVVAQQNVDRQAERARQRPDTQPDRELADYAGDYEHPAYGRITISHVEGKLHWAFRGMSEPLDHRHYHTFELPEEPESPGHLLPGRLAISFSTDREGNITSLAVPFEPLVKDIAFTRTPGGDCMDPNFRQRCTGTFSHGGTTGVVGQDNDGQLTWTFGSQPTYKLRAYQGRTFIIHEFEGFRVEFHLGPDGEVDELFFHEPNGTFVVRRAHVAAPR